MIRLITFATEDFTISAAHLKATALRYGVDDVYIYTPDSLGSFKVAYVDPILEGSRGYGWWIWKPFLVWAYMQICRDGDILIYADAGNEIVDNVNHIISKMDEDMFLFSNGWQHSHWCKYEVAKAINGLMVDNGVEYRHKQVQASAIFFKVNDNTRKFVQEWYAWSIMPGFIDNTPRGPQFPEFQEHRHDQAILTCLQIKYGYKLHWFPSTTNHHQHIEGDNYPQIFFHHRKRNDQW